MTSVLRNLATMSNLRRVCVFLVFLILETPDRAGALPAGRAWTPVQTLKLGGHSFMRPDRFEPTQGGRIELVAGGFGGPLNGRGYGLVWSDSGWNVRWTLDESHYVLWPALTPSDRQLLVWKSMSPPVNTYYNHLVVADVVGNSVAPQDTIALVSALDALIYAATSWGDRRWVAVRDQDFATFGFPEILRIFRQDGTGPWREMGPTGLLGSEGMRIAALDSVTVLVVSGEYHAGIHWGYLRDTTFTEQSPPLSTNPLALIPSLKPRPGGGYIAAWQEFPDTTGQVVVAKFRDSIWSRPETLAVKLPFQVQHEFIQTELSAEGSETPALAWFGYATREDVDYHIWTSFPNGGGFGVGERLEGSRDGVNPTLVRDENGDVWLAWWKFLEDGIFWVHSFTAAEASRPAVSERFGQPLLRWTLSSPAPETWWAVMRGDGDNVMVPVARLRASDDTLLAWADTSAPAGARLRYAIRRECRDTRYQKTSEEALWEPRGLALSVAIRSRNPASATIDLEVIGASQGELQVQLYDLQGREILRQSAVASGAGHDDLSVSPVNSIRPGVYLLRLRSADGRHTPTIKVAVLR